jgi:site-specific DNA-methyltransferase (adenine-specific)
MDNQILHGNCLELMPAIPDKSIDFILADLPYGSSGCSWDQVIPFPDLWEQYERIAKDDAAIVLFGTEPFTSVMVTSRIELFRYKWTWNKLQGGSFQLAKLRPMNITEDICVFSKAKSANGAKLNARYYPIKTMRDKPTRAGGAPSVSDLLHPNSMVALKTIYTDKYPVSLLEYKKTPSQQRLHPTQKPLDLCEYLVQTYTLEGDLVLDNACGSGTTCLAAKNLDRRYIGMELDEHYVEVARKRLE